jgi:hypothetical protein
MGNNYTTFEPRQPGRGTPTDGDVARVERPDSAAPAGDPLPSVRAFKGLDKDRRAMLVADLADPCARQRRYPSTAPQTHQGDAA